MRDAGFFHDKIFYRKLWSLAFPIALQSLMLATVAAMDALMLGYLDPGGSVLGKRRQGDVKRYFLHESALKRPG